MKALAGWLKRLTNAKSGDDFERLTFRIFVPGHTIMNYDGWLLTTEQPRRVPPGFHGGLPETMAVLAYADTKNYSQNLIHHYRLVTDIAAAMSVALERRIDIPNEFASRVEGLDTVTFMPLGGMVDRTITGPLPGDPLSPVAAIFQQIVGLPDDDSSTIGAAGSLFHGALLLHDRDIRSAYTLLIAGIEVLSREYGQSPTEWMAWERSDEWDAFATKYGLSVDQSEALRRQLMNDRQLRLKATFKSYVSSRLRQSFWDQPWVEWMYPLQVPQGTWDAPEKLFEGQVRDFLTADRSALSKALGFSYDLRSRYVHRGAWFDPLDLAMIRGSLVDVNRPLPFAVLRAILRELILTEIAERSRKGVLPTFSLRRNWNPPVPQE